MTGGILPSKNENYGSGLRATDWISKSLPIPLASAVGKPGTDYWDYLRACDQHLYGRSGRAHWGKLHFMTAERLAEQFPRYHDFKELRRSLDPAGVFLNLHLRDLFG